MGDLQGDSVAPRAFAIKLNAMLTLMIVDSVLNGFADHMWDPSQMELNAVICVLSMVIHLLSVLLFFMLLWHTFLLRSGLLLELWAEFRGVFLFSMLRLGVVAAARVPRLLAAVENWKPS